MIVKIGTATTHVTATDHFHFTGNDFVSRALHTIFTRVFARLNAAFNIHLAAFFQILACNLSQTAVHGDVVPFGALLALTIAVFPLFTGSDAEIGHGFTVGQVTHFWVTPQTTDQNHFIH